MHSARIGKSGKEPAPSKKLSHLEIREAENGGHVITHHFESYEHRPEAHAFGEGDSKGVIAHIASAANIISDGGDADPEQSKKSEKDQEDNQNV